MSRNFTLSLILSLCICLLCKVANAITYIDNGTSTTYSLNSGDSLTIASGTYTGIINGFPAGAIITVSGSAIFQPSSMSFPNVHGTIYVYGTFKMTTQLRSNSSFIVNNYGVVSLTSTLLMSGSDQVWTNNLGATMDFVGDVSMTNNNSIINYATINCGANLTMTGSTSINNQKNITITGNYLNSGGTLTNRGKFETIGSITFNSGLAVVYNYCRMISSGGINNTTGQVYNYTYMWAKNDLGLGDIVNSGTITNGPGAMIHGKGFNNTGTVNGAGYLYFYGLTTTTNIGTTGVSGVTTDTIKIYDVTRTNAATVYDDQRGIVNPNVIYNSWGIPDSTRVYAIGCSVEIIMEVPLAINWNYFYVDMIDDIPELSWSGEYDRGTVFEIQRSYDGINFKAINEIEYVYGRANYDYSDRQVNEKSSVVYYRVKAIELSGIEKYTQTRIVKFSNNTRVTIKAAPNPFTSNFVINYHASQNEMINIRIFNVSGQQQLTKNVSVNNGFNSITVTEAAQLAKGMYIIQVFNGSKMISSGKLIKQ